MPANCWAQSSAGGGRQSCNSRPYVLQWCGKVGHDIGVKMRQDNNNSSEKSVGNVQDDGEITMAHADASVVVESVERTA